MQLGAGLSVTSKLPTHAVFAPPHELVIRLVVLATVPKLGRLTICWITAFAAWTAAWRTEVVGLGFVVILRRRGAAREQVDLRGHGIRPVDTNAGRRIRGGIATPSHRRVRVVVGRSAVARGIDAVLDAHILDAFCE